ARIPPGFRIEGPPHALPAAYPGLRDAGPGCRSSRLRSRAEDRARRRAGLNPMSDTTTAATPQLEFMPSRQFPEWLAENRLSLCFSTYQAGKLFFIGLQPNGRLSIFERTFNRAMGLWSDGQTIWMTTLYQLWRFE